MHLWKSGTIIKRALSRLLSLKYKTAVSTLLCLMMVHFAESKTLDQLPMTHPEHFGNPVIGSRRGIVSEKKKKKRAPVIVDRSLCGGVGCCSFQRCAAQHSDVRPLCCSPWLFCYSTIRCAKFYPSAL